MKIIILGAAGFIGTNLAMKLSEDSNNVLTLVDKKIEYFENIKRMKLNNIIIKESNLGFDDNYDEIIKDNDVLYHLISTTYPTTSNKYISQELISNVVLSSNLFDACVRRGIKKVIFISSGGTVYGKEFGCPLSEITPTNPITSYGVQKITIEKLLYVYNYIYGLNFKIVRLANPYGPYQRPNGLLGAVSTFTYKALKKEEIIVYGDGSIIRDFIYIDDAIRAITNIANGKCDYHIFNIGSGYGTSIKEVLEIIENSLRIPLNVKFMEKRSVDVPINYLDISRYETNFGKLNPISLDKGILRTADFMKKYFKI